MFPKWLVGATVSDSGEKWFTLRSLGVLYKRTPAGCEQKYKAGLHISSRGCSFGNTKQTNYKQPYNLRETEGVKQKELT